MRRQCRKRQEVGDKGAAQASSEAIMPFARSDHGAGAGALTPSEDRTRRTGGSMLNKYYAACVHCLSDTHLACPAFCSTVCISSSGPRLANH